MGHGGLKEGQIVNKLLEEYEKKQKKIVTDEEILEEISKNKDKKLFVKPKSSIVVKGTHDLSVRYSKCCNPVPGDEIVGFVTRGRGVSIHRTDCVNMMTLPEIERVRIIEAEWEESSLEEKSDQMYMGEIRIFANNRTGLLADISRVFTENEIDVRATNSRTNRQEIATIEVSFLTKGKSEMMKIIEKIRAIDNVIDIKRTAN